MRFKLFDYNISFTICTQIFELREIVREQEVRIDEMTQCVAQLEEEKQLLRDEIEKLELISKKEQPAIKEQDTYGTLSLDVTDEIHHQVCLQSIYCDLFYAINRLMIFVNSALVTRPG